MYQPYATEEDRQRSAVHYERPLEFFYPILGGDWHVYSCLLWDGATTVTEAQEAKLDLFARLMALAPGQRILDVGCGWGGPLVYLCQRYGMRGVGVTVSPTQRRAVDERAARHGVDARAVESHWREYAPDGPFDGVYSDEVIVHFHDLGEYFRTVRGWLRPGGRMLNKELHLTHPRHGEMNRLMSFINEVFGYTGNYRPLAEELALANEAGLDVVGIQQIPLEHYYRTLDAWLSNMERHREQLEAAVGRGDYERFRTYLRLVRRALHARTMTLDVVLCQKPA